MTQQNAWRILKSDVLLDRPPWLRVSVEKVRLPDGRIVDDYHQVELQDFTAVFVLDVEGKILAIRSYRHALGKETLNLPGGVLEPGETPLEGARRELLEETGHEAENWRDFGVYIGNSSKGCGTYHFFYADQARKVKEPDSGDLETQEILAWNHRQMEAAVDEGSIQSVGTLALVLKGLRRSEKP